MGQGQATGRKRHDYALRMLQGNPFERCTPAESCNTFWPKRNKRHLEGLRGTTQILFRELFS